MPSEKRGPKPIENEGKNQRADRKINHQRKDDGAHQVTAPSPQEQKRTINRLRKLVAKILNNDAPNQPLQCETVLGSHEQVFAICKVWRAALPLDIKTASRVSGASHAQCVAVLESMLNNSSFVANLINPNPPESAAPGTTPPAPQPEQ
jgi:hypothetical protein